MSESGPPSKKKKPTCYICSFCILNIFSSTVVLHPPFFFFFLNTTTGWKISGPTALFFKTTLLLNHKTEHMELFLDPNSKKSTVRSNCGNVNTRLGLDDHNLKGQTERETIPSRFHVVNTSKTLTHLSHPGTPMSLLIRALIRS